MNKNLKIEKRVLLGARLIDENLISLFNKLKNKIFQVKKTLMNLLVMVKFEIINKLKIINTDI